MGHEDDSRAPRPDSTGSRPPAVPAVATATSWPWPKRYAILSGGLVIGYTDLEYPIALTRAAGIMVPAEGFEDVRAVFRLYRDAGYDRAKLREYVAARDGLGLVIADGGSLPLAAAVELLSEWTPTTVVAHVAIRDARYWTSRPRS